MKLCKKLFAVVLAACLLASLVPLQAFAQEPTAGYTWEDGQALPVFCSPADTLDAIDTRGLPFAHKLAAACLQGIVNRTQPRILLCDANENERDLWPDLLELQYTFLEDWEAGVLKYIREIKGIVIWNPEIQDTANVATTIAGITDSLALTPALAGVLLAPPYSLPVICDLREEPITDKVSAYQYLYDNYWADCTRKTISGLAPDGHTNLRDFSVAVRAAVIWLDPREEAEKELLTLFFNDTTALDTFYTGWWPKEENGIAFASSYGVTTIPSDFYLNYTVYAGMSKEIAIPTVPAKPALENKKIYVMLLLSDGDNIQYDQGALLANRLWNSPQRGEVPIGWTASPVMLDAGPQLLNYYYQTATENDVLVCGPSGLGYSTSAQWPNDAFTAKYGRLTNGYFERSAFNIITVWHELTRKNAELFTQDFPALLGLTTQNVALKIRHSGNNTPMVWLGSGFTGLAYESGIDKIKTTLSAAADLPQLSAQFFACQGNVWFTSVSDFVQLRDELEAAYPGRFAFVRPDHFMMLVNEAHNKPYTAALQKTANASGNATDAAQAFDGSFTTGWVAQGSKTWLQVDLGDTYVLDRYVLKNAETAYWDASLNTAAWKLQTSCDGRFWHTVDSVKENTDGIVYRGLQNQKARYVRLLVENPGADGITRVQELEVFGIRQKDNTPCKQLAEHLYGKLTDLTNFIFDIFYPIYNLVKQLIGS